MRSNDVDILAPDLQRRSLRHHGALDSAFAQRVLIRRRPWGVPPATCNETCLGWMETVSAKLLDFLDDALGVLGKGGIDPRGPRPGEYLRRVRRLILLVAGIASE